MPYLKINLWCNNPSKRDHHVVHSWCYGQSAHLFLVSHTGAKTQFPRVWCRKMWIMWKIAFQKCEFCQIWDFRYVNFEENDILKMWLLWKLSFSKCDFSDEIGIFAPMCLVLPSQKTGIAKLGLLGQFCQSVTYSREATWVTFKTV